MIRAANRTSGGPCYAARQRVASAATLFLTAVAAASLVAPGCAHHDQHDVLPRGLQEERPGPASPSPAHPCAALPVDSALRALESKEILGGCPGNVQLRPGTYVEADVLFTCSASPAPMIILRGHGHTPFRAPADTAPRILRDGSWNRCRCPPPLVIRRPTLPGRDWRLSIRSRPHGVHTFSEATSSPASGGFDTHGQLDRAADPNTGACA
jgi:hypothetical protein